MFTGHSCVRYIKDFSFIKYMKTKDIKMMRELYISHKDTPIPKGWFLVKLPCKINENGIDCFKAVIGKE